MASDHICPEHNLPRALDAFSGEGGATKGLMDAGFCVTAIDNDRSRLRHNPAHHTILVEDAVVFIVERGHEFVFIWTSPPCQDYSIGTAAMRAQGRVTGHARLIPVTREALEGTGSAWVIENVYGARAEFVGPFVLCGRMFDLTAEDTDGELLVMDRHRVFQTNFPVAVPEHPEHTDLPVVAGSYGGARRRKGATAAERRWEARNIRKGGYVPDKDVQERLLGIDWMTQKGLYLSVPPIYAQFIAEQFLAS